MRFSYDFVRGVVTFFTYADKLYRKDGLYETYLRPYWQVFRYYCNYFLNLGLNDAYLIFLGNEFLGVPVLSLFLGIIMFGMGTTLNLSDFALILKQPKNIFFGILAQYFVMPFLAFVLSHAFQLEPALAVGVVLVGTCPGGTSSNVITFMSKGDVAFSVTMTSISTLISPIMTPLLTYLILGQSIAFDPVGMFISIV